MPTSPETRAACLDVEERMREAIRSGMRELEEIVKPEWVGLQRAMWNGLVGTVLEAGMEAFPGMVLDEAWMKKMLDRLAVGRERKGGG